MIAPVSCESGNVTSVTKSNETTLESFETTTEATTQTAVTSTDLKITKNNSKKLELFKNEKHDAKRADRGPKPFFYGKKFELQKDLNANRDNSKEDEIQGEKN